MKLGMRLSVRTPLALALFLSACSWQAGPSLENAPVLKGPDGREYRVLAKGAYKAFYGADGRVARLEHDSNGDGRGDQIAYYDGEASPRRLEVDEDFDGKCDRWEAYDAGSALVSVGRSHHHGDKPDVWTYPGPDGRTRRVELDTNGDGRVDRWQDWGAGRLASEDLDTDGDGKADRRIHYGAQGRMSKLETLR
jgi:hypothetical protein